MLYKLLTELTNCTQTGMSTTCLMSIFQESGNFVSFVYLNDIAVAAGGKQVFTVGRDVEVAGMDAGG